MAVKGARGVRLNPAHDVRSRAKIQTSQIINRLNKFVNGEVELSAHQVTAALGLLRKTMPDLTAISGDLNVTHQTHEDKLAALAAVDTDRPYVSDTSTVH